MLGISFTCEFIRSPFQRSIVLFDIYITCNVCKIFVKNQTSLGDLNGKGCPSIDEPASWLVIAKQPAQLATRLNLEGKSQKGKSHNQIRAKCQNAKSAQNFKTKNLRKFGGEKSAQLEHRNLKAEMSRFRLKSTQVAHHVDILRKSR